jgi:hypothetical protein
MIHPACPVRGIHRPQFQPGAHRHRRPARLPLQYGWFFAIEVAPLDFVRLDRAMRRRKEVAA